MTGSLKQERAQMVCALRARGATWVEVAEAVRLRYRVNARVALRLAHSWSQDQVAELWNQRWPDDPKTHKSISYWELWPASTGHAPSLEVLRRLAELYACSVSDLSVDLGDHRHLDPAAEVGPAAPGAGNVDPSGLLMPGQAVVLLQDLLSRPVATDDRVAWVGSPREAARLIHYIPDVDFEELARIIVMWAQLWGQGIDRREVLGKLAAAFSLAAVVPLDLADGDETQRVARFVRDPVDFDEPVLRYCEGMVVNLCRQGDVLGPRLTLHSVMGHRHLAEELAALAPAPLRPRALSAYAHMSRLVGWLCFNAGDYRSAQHYYDQARNAAHDAGDVELVTFILCNMSHLATWQGKPRVGIDHAAAAAVWAGQSASPTARAYAADVAVRAYLADGQRDQCRATLDRERELVTAVHIDTPMASWWYFYDESFYWSTEAEVALKFQPDAALDTIDRSLTLIIDPANLHNRAHNQLLRAEALLSKEYVDEACAAIGEVATITAVSRPRRIDQRIDELRAKLAPWQRTKPVRDLDEVLASHCLASPS